jgi:hypothetical protein
MLIQTVEAYRRALQELKALSADDVRYRELEAAIAAFAQNHNNSRTRRGRPPTNQDATTPRLPED